MVGRIRALPKSFWWSVASLVLMIVGAVGPWATVGALTIHGTDGGRDGWLIVALAAIAGLGVLLCARSRRRWLATIPLLAGLAGIATTAYDISDIKGLTSESVLFGDISVSTGWGIYVALAGSISLTLYSTALLIESRRREPVPVGAPTGT